MRYTPARGRTAAFVVVPSASSAFAKRAVPACCRAHLRGGRGRVASTTTLCRNRSGAGRETARPRGATCERSPDGGSLCRRCFGLEARRTDLRVENGGESALCRGSRYLACAQAGNGSCGTPARRSCTRLPLDVVRAYSVRNRPAGRFFYRQKARSTLHPHQRHTVRGNARHLVRPVSLGPHCVSRIISSVIRPTARSTFEIALI